MSSTMSFNSPPTIVGNCNIDATTILQPKVTIKSLPEERLTETALNLSETIVGQKNIVEDGATIVNCHIGNGNLIGIRCYLEQV
jgi:carbonic anhydrase/acetyltransferase-like protein (isoleucine patch superfamily)